MLLAIKKWCEPILRSLTRNTLHIFVQKSTTIHWCRAKYAIRWGANFHFLMQIVKCLPKLCHMYILIQVESSMKYLLRQCCCNYDRRGTVENCRKTRTSDEIFLLECSTELGYQQLRLRLCETTQHTFLTYHTKAMTI